MIRRITTKKVKWLGQQIKGIDYRMRIVCSHGLNKGFGLKFLEGYWLWQKAPEESWRMEQMKHYDYNNQDEDNIIMINMKCNQKVLRQSFNSLRFKTLINTCSQLSSLYKSRLELLNLGIATKLGEGKLNANLLNCY